MVLPPDLFAGKVHPCHHMIHYPECRNPRVKFVYDEKQSLCAPIIYSGCEPSAKYRYFDTKEHCDRDCLDKEKIDYVF